MVPKMLVRRVSYDGDGSLGGRPQHFQFAYEQGDENK